MAKKKAASLDIAPWAIGAYYRSSYRIIVSSMWGAPTSLIKVPSDSIWYCAEALEPLGMSSIEDTTFVRLVARDPRFDPQLNRLLHYDMPVDRWIRRLRGFTEITSGIELLALIESNQLPIVGGSN